MCARDTTLDEKALKIAELDRKVTEMEESLKASLEESNRKLNILLARLPGVSTQDEDKL